MKSKKSKKFYITTAISYPNGKPHIGHAYEAIITDTVARYYRSKDADVMFLTGTDEHGIKMLQTAKKDGLTAKELADKNTPLFMNMLKDINASNDHFIRTTDNNHKIASTELWNRMTNNGDIYLDKYEGWYSVRDEAYYEESELSKKGNDFLSPQGTPVTWVEEESYFFKLSNYQDKLLKHYDSNPDFIVPETRRNEVVKFVKSGLRDLSISRTTFDWGIKVPENKSHVMYVWVDALTNYLTGVKFPKNDYQKYWPADYHIIGKDILRFHAVYWPAFLMSAKIDLPKKILAHGFLFNKGSKMSKSLGNVIDPSDLIKRYGIDQLRYFFMREVSMGQDGSYDDKSITSRINADLANDLGNLIQRSCSMIKKNCNEIIPEPLKINKTDSRISDGVSSLVERNAILIEKIELNKILNEIWQQISILNKYFSDEKPWELKSTDKERMETILFVTVYNIRKIAIYLYPFMPTSSVKILDLLNVDLDKRSYVNIDDDFKTLFNKKIGDVRPIFPKIEELEIE